MLYSSTYLNAISVLPLLNALMTPQNFEQRVVITPVANLRFQPAAEAKNLKIPTSDVTNPLQITQLLMGEHVIAYHQYQDTNGTDWLLVNVPQQQRFDQPEGWHAYPGWVQASQTKSVSKFLPHNIVVRSKLAKIINDFGDYVCTISMGTRLSGIQINNNTWKILLPDGNQGVIAASDVYEITKTIHESISDLRSSIISSALQFLGDFYSWGGRSAQTPDLNICSVDCSALFNLSFLAHGLQIPRMAHEQFLYSQKIQTCDDLQQGDLIFFASITKKSIRMDHVMMFIGDDQILEATFEDARCVRIVSFHERMGRPCQTIQFGDVVEWNNELFHVYFGSLLPNENFVHMLRDHALIYEYEK